jgi:hypothetical protein
MAGRSDPPEEDEMADWRHLHLTFDPPATAEQVERLNREALAEDYDWPAKCIASRGTTAGQYGGSAGGEDYCLWRSPMDALECGLPALLNSIGLSGHGWLGHDYGDGRSRGPRDADRFTFGYAPEMLARIDHAKRQDALSAAVYAARDAMVKAAESGRDDDLPALARAYREAIAARAALAPLPPAQDPS